MSSISNTVFSNKKRAFQEQGGDAKRVRTQSSAAASSSCAAAASSNAAASSSSDDVSMTEVQSFFHAAAPRHLPQDIEDTAMIDNEPQSLSAAASRSFTVQSPCFFQQSPNEMRLLALSYLTSTETASVACTNKSFHSIVQVARQRIPMLKIEPHQRIQDVLAVFRRANGDVSRITSLDLCDTEVSHSDLLFIAKNFPNLKKLNLSGCKTKITKFSALASLKHLKSLNLSNCKSINDLKSLSKLVNLTELNLSHCNKVKDLSPLSDLTALSSLNLCGFSTRSMERRDLSPLSKLYALSYLNLSSSYFSHLASLAPLKNLTVLNLANCHVKNLEGLNELSYLTDLNLQNIYSYEDNWNTNTAFFMKILRNLNLTALETLNLESNRFLEDLSPFLNCSALKHLNLKGCYIIKDLTPLSHLSNLSSLNLDGCCEISDISPLSSLSRLVDLNLLRCKKIKDFTALAYLVRLENLKLLYITPDNFNIFGTLTALRRLHLESSDWTHKSQASNLSPLSNLKMLTSLELRNFPNIQDISALQGLRHLSYLSIYNCKGIKDFSPLSTLTSLTTLELTGCSQIQDLSFIGTLELLTSFSIHWSNDFTNVGCLQNLKSLKAFHIPNMKEVRNLKLFLDMIALVPLAFKKVTVGFAYGWLPVQSFPAFLNLSELTTLNDLTPLQEITSLESLQISSEYVTDIEPLGSLVNLTHLSLGRDSQVEDFSPLTRLTKLKSFEIYHAKHFKDLTVFLASPELSRLIMRECYNLVDLRPLVMLRNLTFLDTTSSHKVAFVPELPPNCEVKMYKKKTQKKETTAAVV